MESGSERLHPRLRGGFSTGAMQRTASLAVGYRLTPQGFLQGKDLVPNLQGRGILCRPIWCLFLLPQASMSPLLEAGPGPNSFRHQPLGGPASLCRQLPAWRHSGPSNSCIFPGLASQSPCLLPISCALGLMGAHRLAEAPVPLAPWPRLLTSEFYGIENAKPQKGGGSDGHPAPHWHAQRLRVSLGSFIGTSPLPALRTALSNACVHANCGSMVW